jgi:alpha-tubulin suppressor-like RCC1 family protein
VDAVMLGFVRNRLLALVLVGCGNGTGDDPDSGPDADPDLAVAVSCGAGTCAITDKGALKCWGPYAKGCGDECMPRGFPSKVVGLESGVVSVAVNVFHACAALDDGSVRCWGYNVNGELGNSCGSLSCLTSVVVCDLVAPAVKIATGFDTSCALSDGGSVQCWGCVDLGCWKSPTLVDGWHAGVRDLEAGSWYALGAADTGALEYWRMKCPGIEPTEDCPSPPVVVEGLPEPVIDAAGTSNSTCALLESGRIMCWGENNFGELGDGTTEDREQPTQVIGLDGVAIVEVVLGNSHTCALSGDGRVLCWGFNEKGQLGIGHLPEHSPSGSKWYIITQPTEVVGLPEPAVAIAAGGSHSCSVLESGSIYCWGNNMDGQLGNGEDERDECYEVEDYPNCYHPTPVRVVGFGPEPAGGWPQPPEE